MADTKWYCLRVVSNKERKIKERLDMEIDRSGWREAVPNIIVPTEKIYKIRNGKKVIQERTLTPGYIMVEAIPAKFTVDIIQTLASSKDVIHFLGGDRPEPMKDDEVKRLLIKVDSSEEAGESLAEPFIIGEEVKVTEGPFQNFVGNIQEVNEEKKKLKVIIKVFGRGTEVELNFMQVEKQS
jgi:transcription termination/antitermination protein NusG